MKKKLRVSLLANTGIGNEVLRALLSFSDVIIDSIVTRKFDGIFPLFDIPELYQEAERNGILCFSDINVNTEYVDYIKNRNIDLIIVATFHQIIKDELLNLTKTKIINFHPSLLPKYRGPSPIVWAILNGEEKTGITVHLLTKKIDAGDIILQNELNIEKSDFLGSVLFKLSILAGLMTKKLINLYLTDNIALIKQDENKSTYFKRPENERHFKINDPIESIINKIRAFHPFPKAIYIDDQGVKHLVTSYNLNAISSNKMKEMIIISNEKIKIGIIVEPISKK